MIHLSIQSLRSVALLTLALGFLGLSACQGPAETKAPPPLEVGVVRVQPQNVVIYTDFVGSVDGIENADIRARVAGYLEKVHFEEGRKVKAGDLLFSIDPVLSQAEVRRAKGDVAMAQAAASKAQADVERLAPLVATNSVSRQELDHAASAKQSAEAQILAAQGSLATAQANLEFTQVRSPIDGVVGVRQVSIGTLVGQSEPTLLTTVSKLDPVRVRFPISERLYLEHAATLNRLASGEMGDAPRAARLELILADGSLYPHRGWLALIDRAVSVSTGSILLEARFPNPDGVLRPGQFARVRAATAKVDAALGVPQRAVIERQSMHELLVLVQGNQVERRAVTLGEKVGSYWLVEKGLSPGDQVLTEGLQKLKPGMVVIPKEIPLGTISKPASTDAPEPAGTDPADSGDAQSAPAPATGRAPTPGAPQPTAKKAPATKTPAAKAPSPGPGSKEAAAPADGGQ